MQDKLKLIEFVEANPTRTRKDLAAEKKIPESTLSRILSQKSEILKAASDGSKVKRRKVCEFPEIEEALIKWFKQVFFILQKNKT